MRALLVVYPLHHSSRPSDISETETPRKPSTPARTPRPPPPSTPHAPGRETETPTSTPALTPHHIVQHLRTDIHAARPAREATHTSSLGEHFAGIDQVLTAVVAGSLFGITQSFIRLADFLESVRRVLVLRVFVRVMHNGQLAVRLLDVRLTRIFPHAEDFIEILAFRFLKLEFCRANLSYNAWLRGVGVGNGFPFADRVIPVA